VSLLVETRELQGESDMSTATTEEQQEVRVTVEDGRAIYIRGEAIEAIRGEANRQADMHLRSAVELWDECDVTDLDQLKDVRFKLGMAQDAISALVGLAPIPDDEP
jgi:hypothetical protein